MFGIKRAGEMVATLADDIIYGCIRILQAENIKSKPVESNFEHWNIHKMSIQETIKPSDVTADTMGSAHSRADLATEASQVDSVLLRQSALSLMAEVVASAGYGSSRYIEEVIRLASDVLAVEHTATNAAIAMRR